MENTIIITNIAKTYGFGIRMDNGEAVYIPSSLAMNFDLELNGQYKAKLVRNSRDISGNTPWFCGFIFMDKDDDQEPEQPAQEPETREEMAEYIFDTLAKEGAFSTSEMSKRVRRVFSTADVYTARELLVQLFKDGRIIKADIYKSADQKRASLTIWSERMDDIFAGDHDNE